MTIIMDISHITTVDQIRKFLESTQGISIQAESKNEIYEWLNQLLANAGYHKLKKKEKRVVRAFILHITKYSARQLKRLIAKHKQGKLYWKKWQKGGFAGVYMYEDIALLHEVDRCHNVLSGKATKRILIREYEVFGKQEFRKLANISVSHIYNLRHGKIYERMGRIFEKTKSRNVPIGIRKKPRPHGKPGYLRVDSVHQGDLGRRKGIYFINIVDEVTQFEFVFCTVGISQKYMKSILQTLVKLCPFTIINFHSDNGSEYINQIVADLLNSLHIVQTKSRSRKSNDNALVETKNGSIVRKYFGYVHIPATDYNAHLLNTFCINYLNPYLNYHRPCGFATTITDKRGKQKKIYKAQDYQTPYEKLKSLPNSKQYLKPELSFEQLDKIAYNESDTEFAKRMNQAKQETFLKLKLKPEDTYPPKEP